MRWLLLAFLMSVPRPAPAMEDICQANPKCRLHSESGARSFQARDYSAALREFELAYAEKPEPRLLINIGRCQHRLGRPKDAIVSYQRFQQERPNPDPDTRALLDRYVTEATAQSDAMTATAAAKSASEPTAGVEMPKAERAPEKRPIYKTWWFWTATGAGAGVLALTIGLAVGLSPRPHKEIIWQPLP